MIKLVLLLLVASPLLAEAPKKAWLAAFEGAPPNAVLRVNYRSNGCFHGFEYEVDLSFDPSNMVTATVTEITPHQEKIWSEIRFTRAKIGTLKLRGRDVERLMRILRYYESFAAREQVSTTVDHVVFKKIEGDQTLALADIEDRSSSLGDRLDVLTFDEIIERLKPANDSLLPDAVPPPHPI